MMVRLKRFLLPGKSRTNDRGVDDNPTRVSSFPFLSGDTFRQMAGRVFEEGSLSVTRIREDEVFFADAETASSDVWLSTLDEHVASLSSTPRALIIHNGDTVPTAERLQELTAYFEKIFCVNVLDGMAGVTPIPIGLENAWRNKNGRLRYYLDQPEHPGITGDHSRTVLSSFSVATNRALRDPVRVAMAASRHGFQGMVWKSGEFREQIRRSLFVVCPPGNGMDTHRTWEAIYLGAVPVVFRGFLAESLTKTLPVLVVDHIDQFLSLSDDELQDEYLRLRKQPTDLAYSRYWVGQIGRSGDDGR